LYFRKYIDECDTCRISRLERRQIGHRVRSSLIENAVIAFEHFGMERRQGSAATAGTLGVAVTTGWVKAWLMLSSSIHARL